MVLIYRTNAFTVISRDSLGEGLGATEVKHVFCCLTLSIRWFWKVFYSLLRSPPVMQWHELGTEGRRPDRHVRQAWRAPSCNMLIPKKCAVSSSVQASLGGLSDGLCWMASVSCTTIKRGIGIREAHSSWMRGAGWRKFPRKSMPSTLSRTDRLVILHL